MVVSTTGNEIHFNPLRAPAFVGKPARPASRIFWSQRELSFDLPISFSMANPFPNLAHFSVDGKAITELCGRFVEKPTSLVAFNYRNRGNGSTGPQNDIIPALERGTGTSR
jgi:hypothetical protein